MKVLPLRRWSPGSSSHGELGGQLREAMWLTRKQHSQDSGPCLSDSHFSENPERLWKATQGIMSYTEDQVVCCDFASGTHFSNVNTEADIVLNDHSSSSLPGVKMKLAAEMERLIVWSMWPPGPQPYGSRRGLQLLGSPCPRPIPNTLKISWPPQATALTPCRNRGVA